MDKGRPTWAEIDLRVIKKNISGIRRLITPTTMLMAVVKANAYGHGMLKVARASLEAGASYLGVATLEEALQLRREGIEAPILVLGYISEDGAEEVVKNHIDATVFSLETARNYSRAALNYSESAHLHIKIDTGMGRIGFSPNHQTLTLIKQIQSLPGVKLKGIFSHFAIADIKDKSYSQQQIESFLAITRQLPTEGVNITLRHLANSAAIIDMPESNFDMVRAGIIIYGLYPSSEVKRERLNLQPAMRLKSRISYLKTLGPGESVSYGRTFVSPGYTRVATVPIGYADGYSRLLSNRAWAVVRGIKVPLIGNVCMDQCMFDVSEVEAVQEGDEVILFGRPEDGVTADDLAAIMGTINYEVVCDVSDRVPRVYIE